MAVSRKPRTMLVMPSRENAFTRITKFLTPDSGGITLTAEEERILIRWNYCHSLLQEFRYSDEQIAEKVKDLHNVSIYTARNDVKNAQALFSSVTKGVKRYKFLQHIEYIDCTIQRYQADKSLIGLVPKLLEAKTKALAALPEHNEATELPPPVIIVNVVEGQAISQKFDLQKAMEESQKLLDFEKTFEEAEIIDDEPEPEN